MSLISAVVDFLKPNPPIDPAVAQGAGSSRRTGRPGAQMAPNFEKKLAFPLQHALGYCDGLVAALPGPIEINRQAFANDPLVHALFATAEDIDQMLGRSQAVRDFLAEPCSGKVTISTPCLPLAANTRNNWAWSSRATSSRTMCRNWWCIFRGKRWSNPAANLD
jgi:hypothetical protein